MPKSDIKGLLKSKSGIKLDIGCGPNKNPGGFVGIDMLDLPGVDIVHDLEVFPWPLPDECVVTAVSAHVLEHINPHKGVFIDFMNEIWRVLKPGSQFAFIVPHASSAGYQQDPTHVNMINEITMYYFDPDPEFRNLGPSLWNFYRPSPWKVDRQYWNPNGNLEVLLTKRLKDSSFGKVQPEDITKEKL